MNLDAEFFKKQKASNDTISKIAGLAKEAEEQVGDLMAFRKSIDATVMPFINKVLDEFVPNEEKIRKTTKVSNVLQRFEVKKTIRELRSFLDETSDGFKEVNTDYGDLMTDLDDTMNKMSELCSFIPHYEEQQLMATFIANVNSKEGLGVDLGGEEGEQYTKLQIAFLGSQVFSEWSIVASNFQHWIFPFGDRFGNTVTQKSVYDYLKGDDIGQVMPNLVKKIKEWVSDVRTEVKKFTSSIDKKIDTSLFHETFSSDHKSTVPFYTWTLEEHGQKIADLLSGKKVSLQSLPDKLYAEKGMMAVKFSVAELLPKARNPARQSELEQLMENVVINMNHSGISKYMHDGDYVEMVDSKQTIIFNYEKKDGERLNPNGVYTKLKNGDVILSPFTTWQVQYTNVKPETNAEFSKLAKFANEVNLELVGYGTYVDRDLYLSTAGRSRQPNQYHRRI